MLVTKTGVCDALSWLCVRSQKYLPFAPKASALRGPGLYGRLLMLNASLRGKIMQPVGLCTDGNVISVAYT